MIREITVILVGQQTPLRQALTALNEGGLGCVMLVDGDQRFVRVVTDGDLRRAILASDDLDQSLAGLAPVTPLTASEDTSAATARQVMNRAKVVHLPVVNADNRPVGLFHLPSMDAPILLSAPHMGQEERQLVAEAFETNWIAPVGPHVDAFEAELADLVGMDGAVALSSGTAAIHLALRLLDVGPGDTVFCSTLTFVASCNPILYQGASPVFIDSEPESWNMSPGALERGLTDSRKRGKLPKAVICVNIYGQSADYDAIGRICDAFDVPLIEDAAESLGATCGGKASGTFARFGIYSFNGNKIITTSGGGALVSNDLAALDRAKWLATQGRDPAAHYQHSEMAYNYRLSNVLAGIGLGQLRLLPARVEQRRAIFDRYRNGLHDVPGMDWMPEPNWSRSNRWLSVCTFDPDVVGLHPYAIMRQLQQHEIETRPVWKPMHMQPLFRDAPYYAHDEDHSVSDRLFLTGLCLPSGTGMVAADQDRVIAAIRKVLGA
ncbi:MAG: aminotransferase class I/II-fold pyridoxal phosphate-dependent enzyme [Minwuia sp.]|nr:aminotransferase class I/II-fold pyridoxal phosphate-dependent enzyme [Minwuia sp.]